MPVINSLSYLWINCPTCFYMNPLRLRYNLHQSYIIQNSHCPNHRTLQAVSHPELSSRVELGWKFSLFSKNWDRL
jgi:hypothetical protein